jgi:predicted 2-oxoglutarate/Fe(II)-dependent dioxygenase YbiX
MSTRSGLIAVLLIALVLLIFLVVLLLRKSARARKSVDARPAGGDDDQKQPATGTYGGVMTKGIRQFYDDRNQSTRIDLFEELNDHEIAALRSFTRRIGIPHLLDEVIIPTWRGGDSQIVTAVQDRPWPPWGLGARTITALCQTEMVSDASYAVSPVYVTDQDLTNVGLISAVYKEALEQLVVNPRAEICYLAAEGSMLVDRLLRSTGFKKSEDVFVTPSTRYYTYRAPVGELLENLGLYKLSTPDLLAHDQPDNWLEKNALFHQTVYLGSRPDVLGEGVTAAELGRLIRGGHASKPGGVPSGTGRFGIDPFEDPFWAWVSNLVGSGVTDPVPVSRLVDHAVKNQKQFKSATIREPGGQQAVVNEKMRRAVTLDDLGEFETLFAERIKQHLHEVLPRIGVKPFEVGKIEMQLTASQDGDYFRLHKDTDANDTRRVSFVYFFHAEPRRFSGGELRIYPTQMINGRLQPADHAATLSPRQDSIVFFPSLNDHEVLPVHVPSHEFRDSRFTVNGWIHCR